jgi:hypothetical protein
MSAIGTTRKRKKINGSGLCRAAHNGLVAGSSPAGPTSATESKSDIQKISQNLLRSKRQRVVATIIPPLDVFVPPRGIWSNCFCFAGGPI